MDAKKRTKRSDIPPESIKRLIKKGASSTVERRGGKQVRVAKQTTASVQTAAVNLVAKLSDECRRYLRGHKRGTTTHDTLAYVVGNFRPRGFDDVLIQSAAMSKKKSTLSRAGLVRIFKKNGGSKEFRITGKAKMVLVAIVEHYIVHLSKIAGRFASAAGRSTIKPVDIQHALEDMHDA